MKGFFRVFLGFILLGGFLYTLYYLWDQSRQDPILYATKRGRVTNIIKKTVATGSVVPREEVAIKPQISGIIDQVYVQAGQQVQQNDRLARIRVIPDLTALNNAQNRLKTAQINLENTKLNYERNKKLYEEGVIALSEYQQIENQYKNAQQERDAARDNLQIVREGASKGQAENALNEVQATIAGMVLEVPVEKGYQVIESNTFNEGTTIASLADMSRLVFKGKIDESEVGKLREGMAMELNVGAIEDQNFDAILEYISPKGVEENGAIQFEIKAAVKLDSNQFIRAGYSANANIVLDRRDSVFAIEEALVQYDEQGTSFVEVAEGPQQFVRKEVELGLSDGIMVEVLSRIGEADELKVWNQPQ